MSDLELLALARGPVLGGAVILCVAGIVLRLFEIFGLGRRRDLAPPRVPATGSGWRTVFARSLPPPGMLRREPLTYLAGYAFHVGLIVVVFGFAPHIALFRDLVGASWPPLPSALVDAATVVTILALCALLAHRLSHPVKRLLSGMTDYLAWGATFLPVLTGYLAFHHLWLDYTLMLALHVLAAAALLALLPFGKLFHAVGVFVARWFNGDSAARKGVAS